MSSNTGGLIAYQQKWNIKKTKPAEYSTQKASKTRKQKKKEKKPKEIKNTKKQRW